MATMGSYQAPQVVQPGLEAVDERHKYQYVNSYGPEVALNPPTYQSQVQSQSRQRNPFGLSPLAFGLLVGAITAIIMSAALGGGIGGALASCQSQKSRLEATTAPTSAAAQSGGIVASALTAGFTSQPASATTASASATAALATGTVTNYAPTSIRNVSSLVLDCPAIDGTTVKNHFNQDFKYTCGIDLGHQPNAAGGNITDVAAIIAYSIEDCIDACSAITFQTFIQGIKGGPTCSSVTWFSNAESAVGVNNGNCWLKNGTLANGASGNPATDSVSAQLTS